MALKVYIEFVVKNAEKISVATANIGSKLTGLGATLKNVSRGMNEFAEKSTRAFTMPILALSALAVRLSTLAPKTKAMETAFNNLRGVGIGLGQQFQRILVPVVNILADVIAAVVPYVKALADWFTSLSPRTQRIVVLLTALLAALGPIVKIFSSLIAIGGTIIRVFGTLITVIAGLRVATLGWVAGLIAAGGALLYLYNLATQFAEGNFFQVAADLSAGLITAEEAERRLEGRTISLGKAWDDTVSQLSKVGDVLASVIPSFDGLSAGASNAFANVAAGAGSASSALATWAKQTQKYVGEVIVDLKRLAEQSKDTAAVWDEATGTLTGGKDRSRIFRPGQSQGDQSRIGSAVNEASTALERLRNDWQGTIDSIGQSMSDMLVTMVKDWQDAGQAVEDFFTSVADTVLKKLADIASNKIIDLIFGGQGQQGGATDEQNSPMGGVFRQEQPGGAGGGLGGIFGGLKTLFDSFLGLGGGGKDGGAEGGGGLKDILDSFMVGLQSIFGGGQGGEGSFLSGLVGVLDVAWEGLSGLLEGAWSLLADTLWPLFIEIIVAIYDLIAALVVEAASNIFGGFFAEGGSRVFTRPTPIVVGDRGPERFTAEPLGQSSDNDEQRMAMPVMQPQSPNMGITVVLGQGAIVSGISQYRFANTIARQVRNILGRTV